MVFLTPEERYDLHTTAVNSNSSGNSYGLQWFIYDKIEAPKDVADDNILCTKLFSETVFSKKEFAFVFLDIYEQLEKKIRQFYTKEQVYIHIKGSTALALYFMENEEMESSFPFSDIDIVIYINPLTTNFDYVHRQMTILAGQTFAKHKQKLDKMFFIQKSSSDNICHELSDEVNSKFAMANLTSPFVSTQVRNKVSNNSFSIVQSAIDRKKVVKINEAHFDHAEKIPLYRTPIVCSINKTINSKNSVGEILHFNLVRMKMGALGTKGGQVLFDCVDCIIPEMDDHDLVTFFDKGGFHDLASIRVRRLGYDMTIQSLEEAYENLHNLVYKYECPNNKIDERIKKLEVIEEFLT